MQIEHEHIERHFTTADPIIADAIERFGPFQIRLERSPFRMLVRSIISQQLSTKAARSIRQRLEGLVKPRRLTAENLASLTASELRSVGLSGQKTEFLIGLARGVLDGTIKLRGLNRLSDEEVIERLVRIRGVGVWTAQMFLIFSLGRLDVFPKDDFGVRNGIRRLYDLNDHPSVEEAVEIAASWSPFASVASWYCWRILDQ